MSCSQKGSCARKCQCICWCVFAITLPALQPLKTTSVLWDLQVGTCDSGNVCCVFMQNHAISPRPSEEGELLDSSSSITPQAATWPKLQLPPLIPLVPPKPLQCVHCTPSKSQPNRDPDAFQQNTLLPIWEEIQKSSDFATCCSRFTVYTGRCSAQIQRFKPHLNGGAEATGKQRRWRGSLLPATSTYCFPCLASSRV